MKFRTVMCIFAFFLSGCVSVKLGGPKTHPAKGVVFTAPGSPFKKIKAINTDQVWLSEKTGNTISFLSECGGPDIDLNQIEGDALSALSRLEPLRAEVSQYNGREAHKSIAAGEVDGVPVQIALVVFKKNNCNYTLSYGGVRQNYSAEEAEFVRFVENFRAP